MRSVNSQGIKRVYKNIAGLTCYIRWKRVNRPNNLLTVNKNEVPWHLYLFNWHLFSVLNCFYLMDGNAIITIPIKVMFYAFLSSAGKIIQWFSAVPSDICSRSGFMVSTAGHKKAMKIWYSILPDYGLLTGLSIVTVHHGPERIHSGLLNILSAFPCRMYPMDYEGTGFSMSCMVCMRFTHSKDR